MGIDTYCFELGLHDSRLTHRELASGELQPRLLDPGSDIGNGMVVVPYHGTAALHDVASIFFWLLLLQSTPYSKV